VGEISSTHLSALVSGEPIDLARHPIYTEIKAVTYHALGVEQRDGRWMATVIFDL
jgi:SHS2 domain-containing protein